MKYLVLVFILQSCHMRMDSILDNKEIESIESDEIA